MCEVCWRKAQKAGDGLVMEDFQEESPIFEIQIDPLIEFICSQLEKRDENHTFYKDILTIFSLTQLNTHPVAVYQVYRDDLAKRKVNVH